MQLVLSNNRIIAHGENFLAMGGVVINTETGARYENATIAECNGCPSDIDKVGYEYHAGVFVPCAPFGAGNNNGCFMEVCADCATPRNSGIPIKEIKWQKLGSIAIYHDTGENKNYSSAQTLSFPVGESVLTEFSQLRYVIKKGATFSFKGLIYINSYFWNSCWVTLEKGTLPLFDARPTVESKDKQTAVFISDSDCILPFAFERWTNKAIKVYTADDNGETTESTSMKWYLNGEEVNPLEISETVRLVNSPLEISEVSYTIELEGRR